MMVVMAGFLEFQCRHFAARRDYAKFLNTALLM